MASQFFSKFPPVLYDLYGQGYFTLMTNITFRTKLQDYLRNYTTAYYNYNLRDGDTPDSIAMKYYGTNEAWWLVLYCNDIIDPQFDWLMDQDTFNNYIISKYGSIENAMSTVHHYEKIITTTDGRTGVVTVNRYQIDLDDPRVNIGEVLPYETYDSLPDFTQVDTHGTFKDGNGMDMTITKSYVTNYQWEYDRNEEKRTIKLLSREYWSLVAQEFQTLAAAANPISNQYQRDIRPY